MKLAALLVASSLVLSALARATTAATLPSSGARSTVAGVAAGPSPSETVRGFFDALEQKDFPRALAFTDGEAAMRIADLLGHIDAEAARHHAQIELKVRSLRLREGVLDDGVVPVQVRYEIDVIGRKWFFRKLARKLVGTAEFLVDGSAPRITAIVGRLGP
jgi:hypothetical protein